MYDKLDYLSYIIYLERGKNGRLYFDLIPETSSGFLVLEFYVV